MRRIVKQNTALIQEIQKLKKEKDAVLFAHYYVADEIQEIADCACAIENMFIAANSLGIASVWINQLSDLSTNRKFAPLMEKLDIPKTDVIRGCCALGYASDSSDSEPTQKNSEVVSWFLK